MPPPVMTSVEIVVAASTATVIKKTPAIVAATTVATCELVIKLMTPFIIMKILNNKCELNPAKPDHRGIIPFNSKKSHVDPRPVDNRL